MDRCRGAAGRSPPRSLARQPKRWRDPRPRVVHVARRATRDARARRHLPARHRLRAGDRRLARSGRACDRRDHRRARRDRRCGQGARGRCRRACPGRRGRDGRPELPRRLRRGRRARSRLEHVHAGVDRDHLPERQPGTRAEPARSRVRRRGLALHLPRQPGRHRGGRARRVVRGRRAHARDRRLLRGLPRRHGPSPAPVLRRWQPGSRSSCSLPAAARQEHAPRHRTPARSQATLPPSRLPAGRRRSCALRLRRSSSIVRLQASPPHGRVGGGSPIVGDGGGTGVVTADLVTEAGLELPELSAELAGRLTDDRAEHHHRQPGRPRRGRRGRLLELRAASRGPCSNRARSIRSSSPATSAATAR